MYIRDWKLPMARVFPIRQDLRDEAACGITDAPDSMEVFSS
jgi:hypothetical protein